MGGTVINGLVTSGACPGTLAGNNVQPQETLATIRMTAMKRTIKPDAWSCLL
jgi:hypothetical protein